MSEESARLADTEIVPSPVLTPTPAATPKISVQVRMAGRSDSGLVRKFNEDHFLIAKVSRSIAVEQTNLPNAIRPQPETDHGYTMVVADGMGGMGGGAEASQLALITGYQLVRSSERWSLRTDDAEEIRRLKQRFRTYFEEVDRIVSRQGRMIGHPRGMGTTLTVAYSIGPDLFLVHAGDSRAYLCHNGYLQQVTQDHTVAQAMVQSGHIRQDQVQTHHRRHILTNCIGGTSSGVKAELNELRLVDGDRLLLCSDGLTDMVAHDQIRATLAEAETPEQACEQLIAQALEGGGRDNVTVITAFYEIGMETSQAADQASLRGSP